MTSTPTALTLPQLGKFREVITRYKINDHNKGSVVKRITKKTHTLYYSNFSKNTFTGIQSVMGFPQMARTVQSDTKPAADPTPVNVP